MQQTLVSSTPTIQHIPKVIHYCWFGKAPKPELIKQCMDTWKEFLPDYEIIEWNESNFNINCCPYVREAYNSKKWAYVTDYVRLWCLSMFGGIYLDADVQIVKPLDRFLKYKCFTGHETDRLLLASVLGAEKHHPWINYLLLYYQNAEFNPHYLTPNTHIVTDLSQHLIERTDYGFTYLKDSVVIFPITYFAGWNHQLMHPIITEDTYSIHHFCGSWTSRKVVDRRI